MKNLVACFALAFFAALSCHPVKAPEENTKKVFYCDSHLGERISALLANEKADSTLLLEPLLEAAGDCYLARNDTLIAEAWRRIGAIHLDNQDNDRARRCFFNGLRSRLAASAPLHPQVGRFYYNVGISYFNAREYRRALAYFDNALTVPDTVPHLAYYFWAALKRGDAYNRLGQYDLAEYYLQAALRIVREPGATTTDVAEAFQFLSDAQRRLKKYREAIASAQNGITSVTAMQVIDADEALVAAGCWLNLGNAWQDSMLTPGLEEKHRNYAGEMAVFHTEKALSWYRRIKDTGLVASCARNLGELYRRLGEPRRATSILSKALDELRAQPTPDAALNVLAAQLHINRGEALMDENRLSAASSDFDSALYYLVPGYLPGQNRPLPSLTGCLAGPSTTLMLLGDIAALAIRRFGQYPPNHSFVKKALIAYDSLLLETDRLRASYLTEESKISLSQETRPYLDQAFRACMQFFQKTGDKRHLETAFRISEQRKSMVLLESMRFGQLVRTLPENMQHQLKTLDAARNLIGEEMQHSRRDSVKMAKLNARLSDYFETRRKFQDSLSRFVPGFASSATLTPGFIRKNLIGPDQGMLEYFSLDSNLYVFLLRESGMSVDSVRLDVVFYQNAADVVDWLASRRANPLQGLAAEQDFLQKCHYLSLRLLPRPERLPRRVIVIPDEPFITLPFEVLLAGVSPGGFAEQSKARNFLLYRHDFSYDYSANLLWEMQRHQSAKKASFFTRRTVAAFAPVFDKDLRDSTDKFCETCASLKPIPNGKEVINIGKKVLVHTLEGPNATKRNFLQACREYKIVHVATHGILNNDNPRFNFISFSQMAPQLNSREFLYLQELDTCRLDLDLAVFSACETARGKNVENEGNISMARGLAQAGVRSYVTTLSVVRPQQTGELMPLFYGLLISGSTTKDVALAEAKRRFIDKSLDNVSPEAWANVVLMGSTDPVALRKPGFRLRCSLLIGILLLVAAASAYFFRRRLTAR